MQGLVNFTTGLADGIAVMLPAFCYLAACVCFFSAVWSLRGLAHHQNHPHRSRPWVPFVSLVLSGVFASFPHLLTMANTSFGFSSVADVTSYTATTPASAAGVVGATPSATVVNVVALFQYFFQAFGAACVFIAIMRWRSIISGQANGSPTACGIQFAFGVMCINILAVATGVVAMFAP